MREKEVEQGRVPKSHRGSGAPTGASSFHFRPTSRSEACLAAVEAEGLGLLPLTKWFTLTQVLDKLRD